MSPFCHFPPAYEANRLYTHLCDKLHQVSVPQTENAESHLLPDIPEEGDESCTAYLGMGELADFRN